MNFRAPFCTRRFRPTYPPSGEVTSAAIFPFSVLTTWNWTFSPSLRVRYPLDLIALYKGQAGLKLVWNLRILTITPHDNEQSLGGLKRRAGVRIYSIIPVKIELIIPLKNLLIPDNTSRYSVIPPHKMAFFHNSNTKISVILIPLFVFIPRD